MNINLHIDRLILEDIDLSPSQHLRLQASIEAELSHLLTINGLPPHWQNGNWVPRLSTRFKKAAITNPTQLGQQIAQSIYTEMIASGVVLNR